MTPSSSRAASGWAGSGCWSWILSPRSLLTRLVSDYPNLEVLSRIGELEEIEICSRSLKKLKLDVIGTEEVSVSCPELERFAYEVDNAVKGLRGHMPSLVKDEVFAEGNVALEPAVICQIYRGLQNASDVYSEVCE